MRGSFFTTGYSVFGHTLLALSAFLLTSGCNYREDKQNADQGVGKASDPSPDSLIDAKLIQTQVLNSCTNCHSGRKAPLLNSIDAIRGEKERILTELRENAMPPSEAGYSPLSDCRKAVLAAWFDAGAPDNSTAQVSSLAACRSTGGPQPGPSPLPPLEQAPVAYDTVLNRVLKPKCMNCHNPADNSDAAFTLFFPYEEVATAKIWSAPGVNSKVVRKLKRTDDKRMPPPEEGPPLSTEEIDFIVKWIDAGKPL